jgi:putative transposase
VLSKKRDCSAALKFSKKAIGSSGLPEKATIDKSRANTAALEQINNLLFVYGLWHLLIEVRRIKYMNNRVEQDHRGIKNITNYTLDFKSFEAASATIARI